MSLADLRQRVWHAYPTTSNEFEKRALTTRPDKEELRAPECPQCKKCEALLSVVALQPDLDTAGAYWLICRWRCRHCTHAPGVAFRLGPVTEYLLPVVG